MVNLLAGAAHSGSAVQQEAFRLIAGERLAQDRQVALAVEAVSAVRIPGKNHVVAGLHLRDFAAHSLDDPGALVAEHDRQRIRERTLDDFEIGVAQPAGLDLHQHVGRRKCRHLQRVERHRLLDLVQHRRAELHEMFLPVTSDIKQLGMESQSEQLLRERARRNLGKSRQP